MLSNLALFKWLTTALLIFYSTALSAAEQYYNQYCLLYGVNITATSLAQCISACLTSLTCLAISYNVLDKPYCSMATCGNLQLYYTTSCKTIVFGDIDLVSNVDLPDPTYEWIATDACGATGACSLNSASLFGQSASLSATTYVPSRSYSFGNSICGNGTLLQASNINTIGSSITIFYYVKLIQAATSSMQVQFSSGTNSKSLQVLSNTTLVQVTSTLTSCVNCYANAQLNTVASGQWIGFAVSYDAIVGQVNIFVEGQLALTASVGTATTANGGLTYSLSVGGSSMSSNTSVYCVKIFNMTLSTTDLQNIAKSCLIGQIDYNNISITSPSTTTTVSSNCPYSDVNLDGKYYYTNTSIKLTMSSAMNYCEARGYILVQILSRGELMYLMSKLTFPNQGGYWTSLYGARYTNLVWLRNNVSLSTDISTDYLNYDNCCDPPLVCYSLSNFQSTINLNEDGCNGPIWYYSPLCTCQ